MKIVFLDIDGVLNDRQWLQRPDYWQNPCSPALVVRLNSIITRTDAKIVISSSWRISHTRSDLRGFLKRAGLEQLDAFVDVTPRGGKASIRGDEIALWREWTKHVGKFVILDDNSDMGKLLPFLVKTDTEIGIQDVHVEAAVKMLNE